MDANQWPSGINRTKQREGIWQVLSAASKPLTAAEIAAQAGGSQQNIWMSTIYRTLDFFLAKGLVTRTLLANSDMALYELTPHQHRHYAICTHCHKMVPLDGCPLQKLPDALVPKDFTVTGHNLEVYGLCHDCQALLENEKKES